MQRDYTIGELRPDQELAAFALVCCVAPTFDERDWEALFHKVRNWRCLNICDHAGRVRGLAVFRTVMHPEAGMMMDVPIFIALSAANQNEIAESLFAGLQGCATGCQFIRVWNAVPKDLEELEDPSFFRRWDHGLIYRVASDPMSQALQ
jgi:hypothetical protein